MARVLVLSHGEDIDGIGSAAVIKMAYGADPDGVFFSNYTRADLGNARQKLRPLCGNKTVLFITDLGISSDSGKEFTKIIRMVKSKDGRVLWFDHHFWSSEMIKEVAGMCDFAVVGENSLACTTEILVKYTGLKSDFVRRLALLIHYTDFKSYMNTQPKDAWMRKTVRKYAMSINYFNASRSYDARQRNLRRMMNVLCSGRFMSEEIGDAARRFERLNRRRINDVLKKLYIISNRIAVGFSRQVEPTGACMSMISKAHVDVGILINTDSCDANIRSIRSDVFRLANALGGGGHEHAAGFSLPGRYNLKRERDRRLLVNMIEEKARSVGVI